ncbi:ribosomal protein S18-alanine N-acetyltransferase [Chloroflexota bacterium]
MALAYYLRLMRREDVAQVAEIDREAFPTLWPPANYLRELDNRLARYIVACDDERTVEQPDVKAASENGFLRLLSKARRLFDLGRFFGDELPPSGKEYVVGFAGIWIMADEAHITSIAVRKPYLGWGIGELLLISIFNLATELNARLITLEVRVSNTGAQSLYRKYGFTQVGVRRGYYSDNHEDGLLMSTEEMASAGFQARFEQLKRAHFKKLGSALYQIGR